MKFGHAVVKKDVVLYWRHLCHYSAEQVWSSSAAFYNVYPLWENHLFLKVALFLAAYKIFLWPNMNLQKIVYFHYCTEGLTSLLAKKLHLILLTCGHAIGSCVFHLLKISTRIRSLFLDIRESIKVFFTFISYLILWLLGKWWDIFIWCTNAWSMVILLELCFLICFMFYF